MQNEGITASLSGNVALAVLSIGFSKRILFVMFALVARELKRANKVVIISPLKSIILDQIHELNGVCSRRAYPKTISNG